MGAFKLKRMGGPILKPTDENHWESRAVFNPGTVREGDGIHMLYRAVEGENFSTIGYALLSPEGRIMEKSGHPVIFQELPLEKRGCEDPRVVPFEGKNYIFYTGYDGADLVMATNTRVMLAETSDFKSFVKKGMIGPDVQDKDAMIFPERVGNKVVFIHRIAPNIQIAVFEEMEELKCPEKNFWQQHLDNLDQFVLMRPQHDWEVQKIGAGPPPLRTEYGWLFIYHGVDSNKVYRAGAALLDNADPSRVLARLPYPILEPETDYEKYGDVNMVVFPEGIVRFDDELLVFYGAADKVIGMACGKLSDLLNELHRHRLP
jgi:predicted GH43/DUF377 family glycosyl hydrolase